MTTTIGERIKLIREDLGYNKSEFAKYLDVAQSTISTIESGGSVPGYELLTSIVSKIDGLNPQWLLQGLGNMYLKKGEDIKYQFIEKNNESIVDFLKEQLRQKDKIIDKLMNPDKTSSKAGFSA